MRRTSAIHFGMHPLDLPGVDLREQAWNEELTGIVYRTLAVKRFLGQAPDGGPLVLSLGLFYGTDMQNEGALADLNALVGPIAHFVQGAAGTSSLKMLLSSPAVLLSERARLKVGPCEVSTEKTLSSDILRDMIRINGYVRDLRTLLRRRSAGTLSREQADMLLNTQTLLDAFQAAQLGIADGILLEGNRKVLTGKMIRDFAERHGPGESPDYRALYDRAIPFEDFLREKGLAVSSLVGATSPGDRENNASVFPNLVRMVPDATIPVPKKIPVPAGMPPNLLGGDCIFLFSSLKDTGITRMKQILEDLDRESGGGRVLLMMNCRGGDVYSTLELENFLNDSLQRLRVDILATLAASAGVRILCRTNGKRFALPNSRVMIHPTISGGLNLLRPLAELRAMVRNNYQQTDYYEREVAEGTGRPLEEVRKDMSQEMWLNPVEAMLYGSNRTRTGGARENPVNAVAIPDFLRGVLSPVFSNLPKSGNPKPHEGFFDCIVVKDGRYGIFRPELEAYVKAYLKRKFHADDPGHTVSDAELDGYLARHFERKRLPKLDEVTLEPGGEPEDDPLDNPVETIEALKAKARDISSVPGYEDCLPTGADSREIRYFTVSNGEK